MPDIALPGRGLLRRRVRKSSSPLGKGVAVLGLVGLVALAAGCGGAINTVRSAAGEDDAAETPLTSGGNKGTRVCVSNELDAAFEVVFTRADTSDGGQISPGAQRCGEGTRFVGTDVAGEMRFADGRVTTVPFAATNPWVLPPELDVENLGAGLPTSCGIITSSPQLVGKKCNSFEREFELQRLEDTNWKEFLITVRNS